MQIQLNNIVISLSPDVSLAQYEHLYKGADWWISILQFLEQWAKSSPTIPVKTSGSTGEPKVYKVEKSKMWASAHKTCDFFKLNELSKGLLCLSANYIAGKMMLVRAMVANMPLICIEPNSNPLAKLNQSIDFTAMVPMQVQACLTNIDTFNQINTLIIGGAQVSNELVLKLKTSKVNAFETFGMTETLSHIAVRKVSPAYDEFFTPLKGVKINQGEKKQLIITCPDLGVNTLNTNDIIEIGPNNTFKWIGRTDFVINSGGVKISPEEIENKIRFLIKDTNFIVSSIPNEKLGEKVVLVIEGKPYDTTDLLQKIKQTLSSYLYPKEIHFKNEFKRTASGKIKRKGLTF